jgi:excisionase family DNA binding protein
MEVNQSYPNLLSEKQAAARLGVARITLLRAREAGRIKFFRIGTRVLYSEAQLIEFLNACERKGVSNDGATPEPDQKTARRKDNQVSSAKGRAIASSSKPQGVRSRTKRKADQVSLPFAASR